MVSVVPRKGQDTEEEEKEDVECVERSADRGEDVVADCEQQFDDHIHQVKMVFMAEGQQRRVDSGLDVQQLDQELKIS